MTLENMNAEEIKFWAKGEKDAFAHIALEGLYRGVNGRL